MANNKLAIIGGSGLYDVEEFKERELIDLNTPWGKPSDQILKTKYNNKEVYFLPRHGRGHFINPSNINFSNSKIFDRSAIPNIFLIKISSISLSTRCWLTKALLRRDNESLTDPSDAFAIKFRPEVDIFILSI